MAGERQYSPYVGKKISKLVGEGKEQKAAVGQAIGMARSKGYKVPKKPGGGNPGTKQEQRKRAAGGIMAKFKGKMSPRFNSWQPKRRRAMS